MAGIVGDGRDFATVKALLACKNAQDVRSSVVGAVCPCGRDWLGVRDGIRNYLITAA